VIGDHHRHLSAVQRDVVQLVAQTADLQLGMQHALRREAPQQQDAVRLNQPDLLVQVALAGRHLVRFRVPVVGRATLQHVGDEHVRG
jgi:hypothetical protein